MPFGNQCAWSGGLPGGARLRLKRQQSHRPLTPAFKKRCTPVRIGQGFFQLRQAYRQMRQFVVFAGVFVAYLRNNSCINLLVRQFCSLECCAKQNQLIHGETRRSTENCLFCPRRTRRGAENIKGVSDFLCAAAPPFDDGGRPPALRSAAICTRKLFLPFLLL